MRTLKVAIFFYITLGLVFTLLGLIGSEAWYKAYRIWDKADDCGFLFFLAIIYLVPLKERWIVRPLLILSAIRLLWIIFSSVKGIDMNDKWWLAFLFCSLCFVACILNLSERSRIHKWLSKCKYIP